MTNLEKEKVIYLDSLKEQKTWQTLKTHGKGWGVPMLIQSCYKRKSHNRLGMSVNYKR